MTTPNDLGKAIADLEWSEHQLRAQAQYLAAQMELLNPWRHPILYWRCKRALKALAER